MKRARAGWCCATPMAAPCRKTFTRIVSEVKAKLPDAALGIHAHNDTEQAVAVSLAAVRAGARQVQGTLNGLGERCGNANLCSLLPTLMLKEPFASQFETGVSMKQLAQITHVSRLLDEILNRGADRHAPYVGPSAFAHKGGLHSSAMQKDPRTYEHVPPETVGNTRTILVSDQAGRSNLLARLADIGIEVDAKDPRLARLLEDIKQREFLGYAYDGAEASFELLARRALGQVPDYFDVDSFRVIVEKRHNALGELVTVSEATVRVKVDGEMLAQCRRGQRPGQRAGRRAAQGFGQIFRLPRRPRSWSITRSASSPAARRRSPASWSKARTARASAGRRSAFRRTSSMRRSRRWRIRSLTNCFAMARAHSGLTLAGERIRALGR